jgi:hypothetical protein
MYVFLGWFRVLRISQELNTADYAERVRKDLIVEKQLAVGGIRLAAVLNNVLASEDEKARYGVLLL